jgi:hypothetical protein
MSLPKLGVQQTNQMNLCQKSDTQSPRGTMVAGQRSHKHTLGCVLAVIAAHTAPRNVRRETGANSHETGKQPAGKKRMGWLARKSDHPLLILVQFSHVCNRPTTNHHQ